VLLELLLCLTDHAEASSDLAGGVEGLGSQHAVDLDLSVDLQVLEALVDVALQGGDIGTLEARGVQGQGPMHGFLVGHWDGLLSVWEPRSGGEDRS